MSLFKPFEKFSQEALGERIKEEGITTLTSGKSSDNAIQISSLVTSIEGYAFICCETLKTVDLSGCKVLTTIECGAFSGCRSLKSIKFPKFLTEIGFSAFRGCESLETVDLSECIWLKTIDYDAFKGCTSLRTVKLPKSIKEIGWQAFEETAIEEMDLSECTKLTKLGDYVFHLCKSLKTVILPKSLESLECLGYMPAVRQIDLSQCERLTTLKYSLMPHLWEAPNGNMHYVKFYGDQEAAEFEGTKDERVQDDEDIKRGISHADDYKKAKQQLAEAGTLRWKDKEIPNENRHHLDTLIIPNGVTTIREAFFAGIQVQNLYLPPTLVSASIGTGLLMKKGHEPKCEEINGRKKFSLGKMIVEKETHKHFANVYCYSSMIYSNSIPELSQGCLTLHLLSKIYKKCVEQIKKTSKQTQEWPFSEVSEIEKDKLHFYDNLNRGQGMLTNLFKRK